MSKLSMKHDSLHILNSQKSENYKRRHELMKSLELPTMTETKDLLGVPLAEVVFEECPEELKTDFGLEPPLDGPGDELWISPSDLLIGKVCLKPPLTSKHIQALTHQGILEIGAEIEQKFRNEMELEKEEALKKLESYLTNMFENEKIRAIDEVRAEEKARYTEQLNCLVKYYEKVLLDLLTDLTQQMVELEVQLRTENFCLNNMWKKRLEEEVARTIARMNEELLEKLRDQEILLAQIFKHKYQEQEGQKRAAIELMKKECNEEKMQLRHSLECRNIANLMCLLTKERRKCQADKVALETSYEAEIRKLKQTIGRKSNIIRRLRWLKKKETKRVRIRERCLKEILRQYQKLINFALNAAPTQGEFLLDISRLLKFEMDETCVSKGPSKSHPAPPKPPVITEKDLSAKDSDSCHHFFSGPGGLFRIDDYDEEEEEGESDVLPAFFFNEQMYIREDFRDLFNTGGRIERHHPLWNQDVGELQKLCQKTIAQRKLEMEEEKQLSERNLSRSHVSHISNVHFQHLDHRDDVELKEKEIRQIQPRFSPMRDLKKPVTVSSPTTSIINHGDISPHRRNQSIIEAVDSLEIVRNKSSSKVSVLNKKKTSGDTVISNSSKRRSKQDQTFKELNETPKLARKDQSKLTLTRDSLILKISSMERKSLLLVEKERRLNYNAAETSTISSTIKHISEDNVSGGSIPYEISQDMETEDEGQSVQGHSMGLLLANDSVELIKSTAKIHTLKDEERDLGPNDREASRKSVLVFNEEVKAIEIEPVKIPRKIVKPIKRIKKSAVPKKSAKRPGCKLICKVTGDPKSRDYLKQTKEFTTERINSLVNLLKKDSSLIRLFTNCAK